MKKLNALLLGTLFTVTPALADQCTVCLSVDVGASYLRENPRFDEAAFQKEAFNVVGAAIETRGYDVTNDFSKCEYNDILRVSLTSGDIFNPGSGISLTYQNNGRFRDTQYSPNDAAMPISSQDLSWRMKPSKALRKIADEVRAAPANERPLVYCK